LNTDIIYQSVLVHELAGKRSIALEKLKAALKSNYPIDLVRRDPELEKLRSDPGYLNILKGANQQ
jgi:hypothetical protein